jgi:hypothetical protein
MLALDFSQRPGKADQAYLKPREVLWVESTVLDSSTEPSQARAARAGDARARQISENGLEIGQTPFTTSSARPAPSGLRILGLRQSGNIVA